MGATTVSSMIVPELYELAVRGAFANKTAFMGAQAAALGIVKIDGTFPQSGTEVIGTTVNVPYFGTVGEFADRSDGTPVATSSLSMTKESGTILCGSLSWELTRWARSNPLGDVNEEAAAQTLAAAERYMDSKIIAAAVAGNNQLVVDKYSATSPRNIDWDILADAKVAFRDFQSDFAAWAFSSRTLGDLLRMKDSQGHPLLVQPTQPDQPMMVLGLPVIVSDRLPVDNSSLTAVTSTYSTGTPPVITIAGSTNRDGGTGPVRPVDLVIACTTVGTRGNWKFKISIDGGATYTAADLYTSAATVELTDPLDPVGGKLGITVSIAAGTAALDHVWTAKTILKHTSLLLKKNSLAFWYNRNAIGLQTIPVPQNDSIIGASHLYCVAHRYVRRGGEPLPGVCKIRHNAGGL